MDIYTKWAFDRANGNFEKIILAELLDISDENFYVSGHDQAELSKNHLTGSWYKTLKRLEEKKLIYVKRHNHRIEWIKILYP